MASSDTVTVLTGGFESIGGDVATNTLTNFLEWERTRPKSTHNPFFRKASSVWKKKKP